MQTQEFQNGPAIAGVSPVLKGGKMLGEQDIPLEAIMALADSVSEVEVRLQRRNERGEILRIPGGIRMHPKDISILEDKIAQLHGGGKFRVEIRNPQMIAQLLVPVFNLLIPGMPIAPGDSNMRGSEYAQVSGITVNGGGGFERPVARHASDEIAMGQVAELRQELKQLRVQAEQATREADRRTLEAQKLVEDERRRSDEARHRSEMDALKAMIQSNQQQAKPAMSMTELLTGIAAVAGTVVPVITAMITAGKDKEAAAVAASAKITEMQMTQMNGLMQAMMLQNANKTDPVDAIVAKFEKLLPVIMPLVLEFKKQNSPEAQAKMISAMAENQLSMLSMAAQFVNEMGSKDGEQPWWLPMIQETLKGVVDMAAAFAESKKPAGMPEVRQFNGVPRPREVEGGAPAGVDLSKVAPEVIVNYIMGSAEVPADFKTKEWHDILLAMHKQEPVEELAVTIAEHLQTLAEKNKLPEILSNVGTEPEAALSRLVDVLPITQVNPAYASALKAAVLDALTSDDDEEEDAEDEDAPKPNFSKVVETTAEAP